MSRLIFLSALCAVLTACGNKNPETSAAAPKPPAPAASILKVPNDSMLLLHPAASAQGSYYLYSPATVKDVASAPVIICFDPHGDGGLPVAKYRGLAARFGMVLVGSNDSKNGTAPAATEQFANNIIADLGTRIGYKAGHMCLAGFSGGGKVALNAGSNNQNIINVIYAGASTPISSSHVLNLLGFAGTEDMNYTDLLSFAQANPGGQLVEYKGRHEWPDTGTFRQAFYWLSFQRARLDHETPAVEMAALFQKEADKSISSLEKQNNLLMAYQECRNAAAFLSGLRDVTAYQAKMKALEASAGYKSQLAQKTQALQKEASEKQVLLASFQSENGQWWTNTIAHYRSSTAAADKRLLGFISLACYSYSGKLLAQRNIENATFILTIYELADPLNADQLYFHSVLYAMQNNEDESLQYLAKAIKNGYTDLQKIETEPALSQWRGNERFSQVISSLKPGAR